MFGLNEVTSDFYEYHRGQSKEETLLSDYIYTVYLSQGLKQTRLVYKLTPYSTFIGNFAALTLSVYSAIAYILSRFKDFRVDALLLKELYGQRDCNVMPNESFDSLSQSSSSSSQDSTSIKSS